MKVANYCGLIEDKAFTFRVEPIWKKFISEYPQFKDWSGSHRADYHHYGSGGLARHTYEVIEVGLRSAEVLRDTAPIDLVEYFLSALFHDTGKMFDYEPIIEDPRTRQVILWKCAESDHKRCIHHITRSVLIWHDIIQEFPVYQQKYEDRVIHNILAHHGSREYGSPVAPKTREAWLLHLADGISARMDDADKMDLVNKKE